MPIAEDPDRWVRSRGEAAQQMASVALGKCMSSIYGLFDNDDRPSN
jgi:hypothetical protein